MRPRKPRQGSSGAECISLALDGSLPFLTKRRVRPQVRAVGGRHVPLSRL